MASSLHSSYFRLSARKYIEGRAQFMQMLDDIKAEKDGISYVLVFKLSRFGRNAADVLSSLQIMQHLSEI